MICDFYAKCIEGIEMRFIAQPCYAVGQAVFTRAYSTLQTPFHSTLNHNIRSIGASRSVGTFGLNSACFSSTSLNNDNVVEENFSSSYHAPVMWKECIDALLKRSHHFSKKKKKYKHNKNERGINEVSSEEESTNSSRIFIDGTLGGGGHSQYLLQNLSAGDVLIGCDVDPSALTTASTRLKEYICDPNAMGTIENMSSWDKPFFVPVQTNFADAEKNVRDLVHPLTGEPLIDKGVDGILLDLGVSSHQIDNADRGFAFMKDGPLDMRMGAGNWINHDQIQKIDEVSATSINNNIQNKVVTGDGGGFTAADIVNEFPVEELSRIFKVYGDEPRAWKIANSIALSRPLSTTGDLKEAVSKVTPEFAKKGRRMGRTATLARIFQSLRIVVNNEDLVLRQALEDMAPNLIKKGGRLVVLSYHSMEDRATKRVMRDGSVDSTQALIEKDIYGNDIGRGTLRPWKSLGKQKATDEEIERNSRARSATLRVAERI